MTAETPAKDHTRALWIAVFALSAALLCVAAFWLGNATADTGRADNGHKPDKRDHHHMTQRETIKGTVTTIDGDTVTIKVRGGGKARSELASGDKIAILAHR